MFLFCFDFVREVTAVCIVCVQMKCVKQLRGMLMEVDPCVAVTVRKLVMVSLMEILKDITPTYKIRPLTTTEKAAKVAHWHARRCAMIPLVMRMVMMMMMSSSQVKKETQQLREFEEVLLSQYKFYLEDLEQCIKGERRTRVVTSRHPFVFSRRLR